MAPPGPLVIQSSAPLTYLVDHDPGPCSHSVDSVLSLALAPFGRLGVVIATTSWSATQAPGATSGLCEAMLKRVVPESGWTSVDWSQFLGMVNVATVRYWDASLSTSAAPSTINSHRAFVVGINAYGTGGDFPRLVKCVGDARAMAALLDRCGYDVVSVLDPTRAQLVTAFEAFCASLNSSTLKVVVHFSGHGVASGDQFLVARDSSGSPRCARVLCVCQPCLCHAVTLCALSLFLSFFVFLCVVQAPWSLGFK